MAAVLPWCENISVGAQRPLPLPILSILTINNNKKFEYFAFIIHMSDEFVNYTEQAYLKLILRGGISLAATKVRWPHTLESTHRP